MQDPWRGWWIAWPPTQRISLGDVFDRSDGTQRLAGNLADRKITYGTAQGTPPASFSYDAQGSVTAQFKAAGSTPQGFSALTKADAGALVQFARAESVLAVYGNLTQEGFPTTPRWPPTWLGCTGMGSGRPISWPSAT